MTNTITTPSVDVQHPGLLISEGSSAREQQLNPAWQALQLTLWLLAGMLGLPETAYRGLGLNSEELERLRRTHAADIEALRMMQLAARLMDRRATAELLRCRVNCMALAARSPAELAAVARTVRSLPDWVWDDALVSDDSTATSRSAPGLPDSVAQISFTPLAVTADNSCAAGADSADGLNRRQRRALESLLRKGR